MKFYINLILGANYYYRTTIFDESTISCRVFQSFKYTLLFTLKQIYYALIARYAEDIVSLKYIKRTKTINSASKK